MNALGLTSAYAERPARGYIATAANTANWFYRPVKKNRPTFRLYCFPYAGGSPTLFRPWAHAVPDHLEVVGIQLPGRGPRMMEAQLPDMDALACGVADAIARNGDVRFAFFGHSMGALLAFEVTRRLRRQGAPQPCHLFASGCRAPHLKGDRKAVEAMSDDEFLATLRDLNGTPESVLDDPELMDLVFPVLKADFTAIDRWQLRPDRPLDVPITAIGGRTDPHVSAEAVQAWREHTRQEFQFRMFAGDHFFIHDNEQLVLQLIFGSLRVEAWI
jgi:medium-chain acyl-[acyl-carrier-protein] hydrolase